MVEENFNYTQEENDKIILKYKREEFDKMIKIISAASVFTFSSPRPQIFTFPCDVISHILFQKRSPFILLKLYKTCKYFFKKLKVLLIPLSCRCRKTRVFNYSIGYMSEYNMSKNVLFWFSNELKLNYTCSSVLQRIYCTNLKILEIFSLFASFDEFTHLICNSKIEIFYFDRGNIVDSNGTNVPLNIILQKLPYCKDFCYHNENEKFSRDTLIALNQLQFKNIFDKFRFSIFEIVVDTFDIIDAELFWQFIQQNIDQKTSAILVSLHEMESKKIGKIERSFTTAFKNILSWKGPPPKIFTPN